jgi:cytoplasmic iron level regulating protein YaaA (DUF328/UPF0246 family)
MMLAVLSPAKSMDFSPSMARVQTTQPALMKDATSLMRSARGLTQKKLRELMNLSPPLAKLNYQRFRSFDLPFDDSNALAASLAFDGAVYKGLDARSLSPEDLEWSQQHLAILSGLFGLLRPLDLIQAYRLEMGTRLKTRRGQTLYDFWGNRIAKEIQRTVADHEDATLVNLASGEYFKAIRRGKFKGPVVECVFEDWKEREDEGNVIGFLAKYARGAMARFIITERVDRVAGLKDFKVDRYAFQPARSNDNRLIFSRQFVPVEAARATA